MIQRPGRDGGTGPGGVPQSPIASARPGVSRPPVAQGPPLVAATSLPPARSRALGQRPVQLAPPAAREIFGGRLALAERYASLLAGAGVERGLIGPREIGRVWERHILNCAVVADLVPDTGTLADIGSGAGLPGIVLAMLREEVAVTLVEPMLRRAVFLAECVTELGLRNVTVRRGRAEDLAGEIAADTVTARAVAPLHKLAGWAVGLTRPGGVILAVKGDKAEHELRAARQVLGSLGIVGAEIRAVGQGRVEPETVVVRMFVGPGPRRRRTGRRTVVTQRHGT
jgi:16S rRNA (guanine527-N7)-methyltransferase